MLRFGLLGTGYWAAETHAAGLRGHPDADFVGVWGRNPAKAGTIAERYGVRAYSAAKRGQKLLNVCDNTGTTKTVTIATGDGTTTTFSYTPASSLLPIGGLV